MRITLGTLRALLAEAISTTNTTSQAAPSDIDETDARIEGDGDNDGMSSHLRTDVGLGEPGEHDL